MTAISTAIGTERKSRVSGYKIKKGFFDNATPNLRQVIAIIGEANTSNQAGLDTTKKELISAQEAAELYGGGSPIHQVMRILRPQGSDGVGGIPTIVFPQETIEDSTETTHTWTVTGTATKNATHTILISGRRSLDFQSYSYSVVIGDTADIIAKKMSDAVNGVLSSPVTGSNDVFEVDFVTKWKGETSANLKTRVDNAGVDAGLTYALTKVEYGAGTVNLDSFFEQFDNDWNTIVINTYGSNESILSQLEQFNGFPFDENPTGRYQGRIFKPFMSFFGSTANDVDDLVDITDADARINEITNVLCPAPSSEGFPAEAAANVVYLFCRIAQDNPELDVNGQYYPDMPVPQNGMIGDMSDYNVRDLLVKKGCSTVILENGKYQIQDLVTTYHPEGENPLQYAYCRNLNLDWNVKDGYIILEKNNVKDRVIVSDAQVTDVPKSVKPKQWKAVLFDYFEDLAVRALIKDPEFSKNSLNVQVSETNPDRFETFFRYRRTGVARIQSTDAEAGF